GQTLSSIVVNIVDVHGQIDTLNNTNITLTLANPTNGTRSGTTTIAAVNGVATFNDLSLTKTGTYTLQATDGALAPATSKKITVSPDLASTHLNILFA